MTFPCNDCDRVHAGFEPVTLGSGVHHSNHVATEDKLMIWLFDWFIFADFTTGYW